MRTLVPKSAVSMITDPETYPRWKVIAESLLLGGLFVVAIWTRVNVDRWFPEAAPDLAPHILTPVAPIHGSSEGLSEKG